MPKVTFLPQGRSLEIDEDSTLREAARILDVNVRDRCGGIGACCNCVVTVVEGAEHINPLTVIEEAMFFLAEHERLSCQCKIVGDVVVKVL
jgi:2Fe-2S ferredoxin